MIYGFFKRLTDVLISLVCIAGFSPLLFVLAVLVKFTSPGPVFYRGERIGMDGIPFRILKFRSMVMDAEQRGGFSTAMNDARLTVIGRFLRQYKLDELPQFWNVLRGDMSLVGPRPQVKYYTEKYRGEELCILTVRPGITDLASLCFHDMDATLGLGDVDSRYQNEIEPVKNLLRIRYVRKRSFLLDMKILFQTGLMLLGLKNLFGINYPPVKTDKNA